MSVSKLSSRLRFSHKFVLPLPWPMPRKTIHAPELFEAVFSRTALVILVALLLGETTINYIDRQVVSVLAPTLRGHHRRLPDRLCGLVYLRRMGARPPRRRSRTH